MNTLTRTRLFRLACYYILIPNRKYGQLENIVFKNMKSCLNHWNSSYLSSSELRKEYINGNNFSIPERIPDIVRLSSKLKYTRMKINSALIISFTLLILSCKKDKTLDGIDLELFKMAKETSGFTWYKNSDQLLPKSSGSGHNFPRLRTRFNTIAATQLDGAGKIESTALFPEGSLIVKELINDDGSLGRYAILFKAANDENADANGWVWGYINEDQTIASSAKEKGASCISCHQQAGNVDYMLMNTFFP